MGNNQQQAPLAIKEAIKSIDSYYAVKKVMDVSVQHHAVIVTTEWKVELPNRFHKKGVSGTNVRKTETVYWNFPLEYPQKAPSPRLRLDFPSNFPHINPQKGRDLVYPCIAELSLDDLLHSAGLLALFDAMSQWLNNAAVDELHCPVQGWEHVRRNNIKGIVYTDAHAIRAGLDSSADVVKFCYYKYYYAGNSDFLVGYIPPSLKGAANTVLKKRPLGTNTQTSVRIAPGVLFRTDGVKVFDKYRTETVHNFKSLRCFSKYLGLQDAFNARLKYILSISNPQDIEKNGRTALEEFMVIFAVKRPFNLIGTKSSWELLAYRVNYSVDHKVKIPDESIVRPTQLIEKTCPQLLQAVSDEQVNQPVKLGILGCGSLGSKVSIHLAKTGCYEFELVDNDYFSSHNNARHGLIVKDFDNWCFSKSQLLSHHLSDLNIESMPIDKGVQSMGNKEGFALNKNTEYVLDTTASQPVRYYLSHHCKSLPGKLIQLTLYGKSTMAVVAIEGSSRSVRIDDLAAFVNTLCIDNCRVKEAMYGGDGPLLNHFGEGCGSVTTRMNDIDISLMSAAVSSRLNKHIKHEGSDSSGILHVGVIDHSSLDMTWVIYKFPPTLIIPKNGNFDWDIRVLGTVVQKIERQSNEDSSLENGGIIAGQVCNLSKTIYVNLLFDSPKNSLRSKDSFVLRTQGLSGKFEGIHELTNGQITFLGTWHSHTSATPPSTIDKNSLKKLQVNYDLPITMLVYTGGRIVRVEC